MEINKKELGEQLKRDGHISLRGSYPFCSLEANDKDRSLRLGTFDIVKEKETFKETDALFGH